MIDRQKLRTALADTLQCVVVDGRCVEAEHDYSVTDAPCGTVEAVLDAVAAHITQEPTA